MAGHSLHILLVEDDEVDAEVVQRALQQQQIAFQITHANDGLQALQMLYCEGWRSNLCQPDLILLDINLPRMNGIEFLQRLRQDAALKTHIVFVLTTSALEEDKLAAYNENIAGYFLKSNLQKALSDFVKLLVTYAQVIEFPPKQSLLSDLYKEADDSSLNCA